MAKKREEEAQVTLGSGNVFQDMGLPEPGEAMAKAKLIKAIGHVMATSGLTQAQVAEVAGLDQPKVSRLMRGNMGGFTTDKLLSILNSLGHDVNIMIQPRPMGAKRPGRTDVAFTAT